jgi:filamentous hemagglutinin family protein
MSDGVRSRRLGPLLLAALLAAGPVQAQIATDGSVGPKVSLRGGEIEIGADLGTRRGDNLFHSFEKFGIATGQTTTFTGPGDIKNVISRVTGGETSNIDGKLALTVGQADLYFINPAGVMFGPNATLDVPGSFHVSTAHELRFADGTRFSAVDKVGSGLTVAPPEAFGFLDMPPGRIAVDQSQLQLKPGKMLLLVGGDLDLTGGTIAVADEPPVGAPNPGLIFNAVSIASPGEVRVSDGAVSASQLGSIRMADQRVTASGDGGGTVRIRAGTLTASNSAIDADNTGDRDATNGVHLQASLLTIDNSRVFLEARNSGRGGAISVLAGTMVMRNEAAIQTRIMGTGGGGAVAISARSIRLSNGSKVSTESTGFHPNVGVDSSITIVATDTLELDHSVIWAEAASHYAGKVTHAGDGMPPSTAGTYVFGPDDVTHAGDVTLAVGRLFDLSNSTVTTQVGFGNSRGGNIFVHAPPSSSGSTGSTRFVVLNNSAISANVLGGWDGGNILVKADHIMMTPDSVLQASSSIGVSGTFNNVVDALPVLSATFLDASSQLHETCAARGGRPTSSFAAGGGGGLPPDPGTPLAASSFGQPPKQQTAIGSPTPSSRSSPAVKPITVAGIPQPVLGSPRLTCRG